MPEESTAQQEQTQRTFTQDDVNRIVADRLARAKSEPPADYEELKAKAAEYDKAQEAAKSELQKAVERAEKAEASVKRMEDERARNAEVELNDPPNLGGLQATDTWFWSGPMEHSLPHSRKPEMETGDLTMQGLRGNDTTINEKSLRFFAVVQNEAAKEDKIFFVSTGDGDVTDNGVFECETLVGWLIDKELAGQFQTRWESDSVDSSFDEFLFSAEWDLADSGVDAHFNKIF